MPHRLPKIHIALAAFGYVWFTLCVIFLYGAAFTDPGYLPRGNEPPPEPHKQMKADGTKYCGMFYVIGLILHVL